ncbi:hypothetical protein FRB91_008713, partial [Serendipita sp. 411]
MDDVLPTNRHSGETTAIDTPVPTTLEIWCIVLGEKAPFRVTIPRNQLVDDLKEAIHNKKRSLSFTDPNLLTLYEINLPGEDNNLSKTVETMPPEAKKLLNPMDRLSKVFPGPLDRPAVRILVQPPEL